MYIHSDNQVFDGKPPKSAAEIRRVLHAIRARSNPQLPGPYLGGLPAEEIVAVQIAAHVSIRRRPAAAALPLPRDSAFYRRLLLTTITNAGGICGGLLGANLGLALPIMLGNVAAIPLATSWGMLIGCTLGGFVARETLFRKRIDLFRNRSSC